MLITKNLIKAPLNKRQRMHLHPEGCLANFLAGRPRALRMSRKCSIKLEEVKTLWLREIGSYHMKAWEGQKGLKEGQGPLGG